MSKDLIRVMQALFLPAAEGCRESSLWHPAADVYQTRQGWLVKFDLAGVRPEDLELIVGDNCVTIRGTRRDCTREEGASYYRLEIAYSRFERTVELPGRLNRSQIATDYRDGMLFVQLTPTPEEKSRERPH